MASNELGLLHVYTGEGKGKTTASLGLALRAWGQDLRICVIQFMKKSEEYGEIRGLRRMGIEVFQFGTGDLVFKGRHCQDDVDCAQRALDFSKAQLSCGEYDMVILDEVNVAVYFGLVSVDKVIEVLRSRGHGVEVICTGRNAPEELKREADLVTVMKMEKHPYDDGLKARRGIEF